MYTNKQIWSVSYPILLSLLAQNVINVTDTAFLGHVSEVALVASAESLADAIHDNRMFAKRAFYCIANGSGEL